MRATAKELGRVISRGGPNAGRGYPLPSHQLASPQLQATTLGKWCLQ